MEAHWSEILTGVLGGTTAWSLLGHAVSTFPIPDNKYARWALGVIQWLVGQREQSSATRGGTSTGTGTFRIESKIGSASLGTGQGIDAIIVSGPGPRTNTTTNVPESSNT